jgi:hypothetical protein
MTFVHAYGPRGCMQIEWHMSLKAVSHRYDFFCCEECGCRTSIPWRLSLQAMLEVGRYCSPSLSYPQATPPRHKSPYANWEVVEHVDSPLRPRHDRVRKKLVNRFVPSSTYTVATQQEVLLGVARSVLGTAPRHPGSRCFHD